MGFESETLDFILNVVDEGTAKLASFRGEVTATGEQAETANRSFMGMNATMGNLAGAVVAGAAIGEFTRFLGDSVKAAVDLEASTKRLNQSLSDNVAGWKGDTTAIDAAISKRKELGFTDTDLQQSAAFLVGATHNVTQALDVQSVAMDLARYKGISLQDASEALVKVEAGRYRLLQSLGINIKANATAEEALGAVQAIAAGQAEAFGNTTAGAMAKADEAVHSLQEEIGQKLTPALAAAATGLAAILQPQQDSNDNWALLGRTVQAITSPDSIPKLISDTLDVAKAATTATRDTSSWDGSMVQLAADVLATSAAFRQGATDTRTNSDALDGLQGRAQAAALGLDATTAANSRTAAAAYAAANPISAEAAALDILAFKAAVAASNLDAVNRTRAGYANAAQDANNKRLRQTGEVDAAGASGSDIAGGLQIAPFDYTPPVYPGFVFPKDKTGGGSGASEAAAAAKQAAQVIQDAYRADQTAGDDYIDSVHAHNDTILADADATANKQIDAAHATRDAQIESSHQSAQQQIEDAHKAADAKIQEDRAAVDAQLAGQLKSNGAAVTAFEKQLQDQQDARRQAQLTQQLRADQASGNATGAAADQQGLADLADQVTLQGLRAQQQVADDAARAQAAAAKKQLDDQQTAENDTYTANKTAEQATYTQQKSAEQAQYTANKATEQAEYDKRKAIEDARYTLQKKMFDDHIAALEASKNATAHLAEVEELAFLNKQLDANPDGDPQHAMALYNYNKFAKANPDLGAVPRRAGGGSVAAGDLYRVNEDDTEYFRPNISGQVIPLGGQGAAGGDVHLHVHLEGTFFDPFGMAADQVAVALAPSLQRMLDQQRMTLR